MASHFQNLLQPQEPLTPPEGPAGKHMIDSTLSVDYILWKAGSTFRNVRDLCAAYVNLHRIHVDHVFPGPPAAGRPDAARHGDLGERGRGLLPQAVGSVLQPRHAVRQRGLLLHRHRGGAGAAGAPRLLRGPKGEQVSAANGKVCKNVRGEVYFYFPQEVVEVKLELQGEHMSIRTRCSVSAGCSRRRRRRLSL